MCKFFGTVFLHIVVFLLNKGEEWLISAGDENYFRRLKNIAIYFFCCGRKNNRYKAT
ncbi:MAG TPA: hypothetical protein VNM35_04300 [Chitinophagaceae bacterium]|nr:hypothetical protein [Chitinophagaceae bacterium]